MCDFIHLVSIHLLFRLDDLTVAFSVFSLRMIVYKCLFSGVGIAFNLIWIGIVIALVVTGALVSRTVVSSFDEYYGK